MEDEKIESEYDYALEAKCRRLKKRLDEMATKKLRRRVLKKVLKSEKKKE